jgi:hypothetical protein
LDRQATITVLAVRRPFCCAKPTARGGGALIAASAPMRASDCNMLDDEICEWE